MDVFLMMFAHIMGGRGLLFFSGSDKEGTLAARVLKRPSNGGGGGGGGGKNKEGKRNSPNSLAGISLFTIDSGGVPSY